MNRITPLFTPGDCPSDADPETRREIGAFFAAMFPGNPAPAIDGPHTGLALAAHSPVFAQKLSALTSSVVLELGWSKRQDLMELAIQAVNLHFGCSFSFETRLGKADGTGIGLARIAALPMWRTSKLFDDEQRLVLEYVEAVVTGSVPDELFARVKEKWGQKGTVEFTAVIGTFSLWAMLINATL